ncbi:hypothetical protein [Pasteuria penetrans]|uniref:hypothetical protein n=1 Tax=Pasteuria penetrans TaxID=86005 RepID=UPI0011F08F32|nr:hypothetical protein [Pasteuria penetrans]
MWGVLPYTGAGLCRLHVAVVGHSSVLRQYTMAVVGVGRIPTYRMVGKSAPIAALLRRGIVLSLLICWCRFWRLVVVHPSILPKPQGASLPYYLGDRKRDHPLPNSLPHG